MKHIDNHCHLNFEVYDTDREEVLQRMLHDGVGAIVVGINRDTSKKAVELAKENENLWSIVGLHPINTSPSFDEETKKTVSEGEIFDTDYYRELARDSRCVGIGECGFDFFRVSADSYDIQEKAFRAQIELALELDKPLMLHMRSGNGLNAYQESLKILREYNVTRGEAHFFAGSIEDAKDFLDLGFHISFTGVITFAKQYEELVKYIPNDRLLSETDSPYVAPVPFRGKRCEPTYVTEVVEKMVRIKDEDFNDFRGQLLQNSKDLWKWG